MIAKASAGVTSDSAADQWCRERVREGTRPTGRLLPFDTDPAQERCLLELQIGRAPGQSGQARLKAGRHALAPERCAHQQRMDVGLADHPSQFGPRREGGKGDGEGADTSQGEPGHRPRRSVRKEQSHPGSLADAAGQQPAGQLGTLGVRLRKGQPEVDADDEGVGSVPEAPLQGRGNGRGEIFQPGGQAISAQRISRGCHRCRRATEQPPGRGNTRRRSPC